MEYTTKLLYQSNYWYNDGLKKAGIRDLSGAIKSLRRSLQFNRGNIAARNLLGLVYYGRGDVIEALVEWILSKNFQSHDNIANYYIKKMQEVPGELEQMNQCVKKFNQSLDFAKQNGEDMAIIQLKKVLAIHPNYVKAYQLLALLYINAEQYSQARQVLRAAHKLDTTDEVTLRYMHEITQARRERPVRVRDRGKRQTEQTVTYNIGNETIIQPSSSVFREGLGRHALMNMGIGALIGIAVMWFLVTPARDYQRQKDLNGQTVDFSDKIAMQEAQISALKTELETYRTASDEGENVQVTAESTQASYEAVINVYRHFAEGDMSDKDMLEEMLKISPDTLGERGKERYDTVADDLFPRMCEKYYDAAKDAVEEGDYESAVSNLEQVMKIDEDYGDGAAMLLLAQSYERQGQQDKANVLYQSLAEKYKDEAVGRTAKGALEDQNGKSTRNGTESSGLKDEGSDSSEEDESGDLSEEDAEETEGEE